MSKESPEVAGDTPPATPRAKRHFRRTMLSTGFGDAPGRTCDICGFEGFRWQKECPRGHPLG